MLPFRLYTKEMSILSRQLIAFDMDGTLLNSRKEVSEKTLQAIRKAYKAGKVLVFNSGRGMAEMTDYFELLPEFRYALCCSGTLIYDIWEKRVVSCRPIPRKYMEIMIRDILPLEDTMPQLATPELVWLARKNFSQLDRYFMGHFRASFERFMTPVDSVTETYLSGTEECLKFNIYHSTVEARERTLERLAALRLPLALTRSEVTSVEVTAGGADKGSGILKLCDLLGMSRESTIAVGDAENDLPALKAAGLGIAMGNARGIVLEAADETVADCDHDGCAEAIERFLLDD